MATRHSPTWYSHLGVPLIIIIALNVVEKLPHSMQPDQNEFDNEERYMTTADIIRKRGFPLEVHQAVTEDGYILELHRIPYGRNGLSPNNRSRPVFLQHGLLWNDHAWMMNPTNSSLAFILADHGYDVWMGNSRGNSNSRKHVSLDPEKEEYWNFTWDEMGRFDIPASIDYILNVTGQDKLSAYIGYSLGCTLFFIGAIDKPKLNNQVEMMIGLGPTASIAHLDNFYRYLGMVVKSYHFLVRMTCTTVLHSNDGFSHNLLKLFCDSGRFAANLCVHLLFQIFGYSQSYYVSALNAIIGHYPDGTSIGAAVQFLQHSNSGESFHHFDYGCHENRKRYGTCTPAHYDLSLVTAPVYLMSGDKDPIAPPKDVQWLATKLGNLKSSTEIESPFTHGDFLWSTRATELVYLPIISLLSTSHLTSSV
ncbi:gastric triacylglycerol lipase [Daphnia magna]|uniref:Lipase n=1 Tax=Daphnia magna TaxID=35525 RepID=A0A0P5YWW5_9CRUS|nr:gastric triacylglycerol lipase [Daphnia magna]XP_045028282.1 gastric triacylglycerol lipase [Daphnia magna]KZS17525.1 Gastric triacylglycerol lipase [Daphnia magna]